MVKALSLAEFTIVSDKLPQPFINKYLNNNLKEKEGHIMSVQSNGIDSKDIEEYDDDGNKTARLRNLKGVVSIIVSLIAIGMSLFHLYTALFGVFESILQRSAHLGFALILVYAIYKPMRKAKKAETVPWYDWLLMILSATAYAYFVFNAQDISSRMTYIESLTGLQITIGIVAAIVLIEATRRVVGSALVVIVVLFVAYGLWGQFLPSIVAHRGFDLMWIMDHLYYTISGVFSTQLGVSFFVIFLFCFLCHCLQTSRSV